MITSRQKLILKAIIEIYVKTGEPIGSKALTSWPYLDYSSATIRYDMQMLEELGYLEKTHTSSGRVPSTKGFRYYLENLVTRDSEINELFPMIDRAFEGFEGSKEHAVKSAIDLLSELTNYTSIVLGPDSGNLKIKKIDYINISMNEAVILIVTNKGHVQSQVFPLPYSVSKQAFKDTIKTLDELLQNQQLRDAKRILTAAYTKEDVIEYMEYKNQIVDALIRGFSNISDQNIYLTGMGNMITKTDIEDPQEIKALLRFLDHKELLKVIGRKNKLSFRIGREAEFMPTEKCTIISVPYHTNDDEIGSIAIIGPKRMDYAKVIPLMEYIAKNITKLYKK